MTTQRQIDNEDKNWEQTRAKRYKEKWSNLALT